MRTFSRIFEKIIAITLIIVLLTGSVSPYAYAADMTDSIYDMAEQDAEKPADMDETVQGSAYLDPEVAEDGTPETGADLLADVLTTEEMEETLPLNSLTGDWSEDLLQVAQSQEDIPESILNYTEDEDGTVHPYSCYGDWAGIPYGKWDAAFVSFCLHYAGIPEVAFSHYTDTSEWVISLMDAGSFLAPGTYEPLPGDIVFLGPAGALDGLTAEEDDDDYNVYIDKDVRVGIVLDTRAVTETDSETGEETEIPVMDVITGDAGDSIYGEYYTPDQLAAMQSEETTEYSDGPDRVRTVTCRTDAEEILGYASLPEEYTKQTMEARIFTDASMETEAEDPADGIRLVGMLPNGGYAAAYPVEAALTNGAKTWLAYEISLFDGSGSRVQPDHGGVILEFYGTTVGRALRESGGLAFYHVITDDDGEEVEEKITAYLESGEEAKKLNISVPEEDGEEDTDDETSGTVFCTAEGFSVYILGNSEAPEEENPKKGPAPAEDETEDKAAASNRKGGGDETPQTRDASDVYNNGMIYISNYSQLAAIGASTPVQVTDTDRIESTFGQGSPIPISGSGTQEDPYVYLTYSNDAVYYLTNDIELPKNQHITLIGDTSRGAWKVPAGFTGMFTSAAACDMQHGIIQDNSVLLINQPAGSYTLYESTGKKVYYYNRYQIEEGTTTNILDCHFDPLNYTGNNLSGRPEYDYNNNYYIAEEFTAQTKFDTTEYKNTTDSQGNPVTAIVIRDYAHLKLVGKGVSDVNPSETLNGIEHIKTVNYPSDAVYYLANDITLADDGWQLPADFTGSFTCDKTEPTYGTDKQRLYTRHTASTSRADVYIQNIYQLEIIGQSNDIRSEEPVFDHDYDAAYVGTGSVVYLTNVSTDYLTYNTGNTYILSRTFSNERVQQVSSTVLGELTNADHVDGRDFFGQTTVDIDGTTYILIGDRQQLDVIGKKDTFGNYMEVHGPVYAVTQTRSSILDPWTIDSSRVSLVYPGDADLISGVKMDPAGTQTYDFSTSPLFNDSGSSYHSLGTVRVSSYERVVYCTSDGKGGYNIRANSSGSGSGPQSYAKNANYIVFRDIDMRVHKNEDYRNSEVVEDSPVWRPLMFTGTMIGAKINSQGEKLWNSTANSAATEITAQGEQHRPVISYINIQPALDSYLGVNNCIDLEVQEGVGFFGTISSDINDSTYNETKAEVKNLKLSHGVVTNNAVYTKVEQSLLNILTDSIVGRLVDELVSTLLSALTGANIDTTLQDLLDTRRGDPNNLATGGFAGKIVGQAEVTDCEIECFSVNTVATLYETGSSTLVNNEVGGKIVGKGGFVGHVEGTAAYSGLSSALNGVTSLLERVLNLIPGLGLGDLITLLLRNVLAVSYLTPTGYNAPVVNNCTVSKTVLSKEDGKFGVGGFAGSVEGVRIEDCLVKDCDYMTVNAEMFGGGFAGVVRDGVITTTLSGLNVVLSQNLFPNGELVSCTIEDSDIYITGYSVLGGFVGILSNSYAINDTVDEDSRIIVESKEDEEGEEHVKDYVGGFAGEAVMGSAITLGEHIQSATDLLSTVTGLLSGVLSSGNSQALLDVAGVAPSAIMGCVLDGSVEVSTFGNYAGGILGYGTGTLITSSDEAYIRKLHKYEEAAVLPITANESRGNEVSNLVGVSAANYAGGIAGYLESASAGGLLGNTLGIGNFLKFTVCDTDINGISIDDYNDYYAQDREKSICEIQEHHSKFTPYAHNPEASSRESDGYTVTASGYYAGGGLGWAVGGDVYDVELTQLKSVTARNYAGGFVGATGPGDLLGAAGLSLSLLGVDLISAQNLLSVGKGVRTNYMRANVTGVSDGFTVEETGSKLDTAEADYTAGGYAGQANSVTIRDCHVKNLLSVKANMQDGIAGGFVGQSSAGGLASLLDDGNTNALQALTVSGLLGAVPYMIPKFEGDDVTYVNGGFVEGDTAGGFTGDFQSGFVNKHVMDAMVSAREADPEDPDYPTTFSYLKYPEDTFAETDPRDSETVDFAVGTSSQPWSVHNIHHVRGGQYAGGWGGKVYSGALASAGGGISLLSTSNASGGSIGTLDVTSLLSLAESYVPMIGYAGVDSFDPENGNYGFSVYAAHDGGVSAAPASSGYAGGFIGYGSGVQVSYSDVSRLKTGEPTEPDALTALDELAYAVTGVRPDALESQDGSNYMRFENVPDEIPYAVAGAYYAGGYIGHMDVGSAASVGDGIQLLSGTVDLKNILSTLNAVVSTIGHSDVYGAPGGFSVIASPRINNPEGIYGDEEYLGVSHSGGFAGKISGGHTQDSNVNNFYYIIGEVTAGGYVGELVPGDVASVLGNKEDENGNNLTIDVLNDLLGQTLAEASSLASLIQDFVPTIRNSYTNCVPCGGAVRAQCSSDNSLNEGNIVRGMAGGYVGHAKGAQIWGYSDDTWKDENNAIDPITHNEVYWDPISRTRYNTTIGTYICDEEQKRECAAIRIRSVYGREYAGGYVGLMEPGSTAEAGGGLSLLGGLVNASNLVSALKVVYSTIRYAAVYGPLEDVDEQTWNAWVTWVGRYGSFYPELARSSYEDIGNFVYKTNVVAGRHRYDNWKTTALSGTAGGFVGSLYSGVIRHSHAEDTGLVTAMRAAGGFAGEMQTKGAADFGSVGLLGLNLNLGNIVDDVLSVFVPEISESGTNGCRTGLTVAATGERDHPGVGMAGGYCGASYGGQLGLNQDGLTAGSPSVYVHKLKLVTGTNAIGGFVGKSAAASVASVDASEGSAGFLQDILNSLVSTSGELANLAQATLSTIKYAEVTASDSEWGIVVDGQYNNGTETEYARYAGGFAGMLEAAVLGEHNKPDDTLIVQDLRSVIGGHYVGGFFGLGDVGSVAEVGGTAENSRTKLLSLLYADGLSAVNAFRTYIYNAQVTGVSDGITVTAHDWVSSGVMSTYQVSGAAGGFGGGLINGTVWDSTVSNISAVTAPHYSAGFIAIMDRNGIASVDNLSVSDEHTLGKLLTFLGLDLSANVELLNIIGSTVERCSAGGIPAGFTVVSKEVQRPVETVVNVVDLTGSCAAGFTGFGDVSQIEDCSVSNLKYAKSPQIAAGFIGRSSVAYLVSTGVSSGLTEGLISLVNVLLRILYVNGLENLDLIDLPGEYAGLQLLADGNLLYVNLFGLRIGVSLSRNDQEYGGNQDAAIITIGSSTIKLPCDENGIDTSSPNVAVSLIEVNRTYVNGCTVTGIPVGYDVFGGGTDQEEAESGTDSDTGENGTDPGTGENGTDPGTGENGTDPETGENGTDPDTGEDDNDTAAVDPASIYWGYAGGFVGYNDNGYFSDDRMWLCDVVKGTDGKVGPFSGWTKASSRPVEWFEGYDNTLLGDREPNNNYYSIYREENAELNSVYTANNILFGSNTPVTQGGISYNRYDVLHYQVIEKHSDLIGAVQKGTGADVPLNAWISAGEADLMLNTPLLPNSESEAVPPDDLKDPCDELVDIHIHKKWRDYGNYLGSRPDSIEVEVLAIDVGTQPRWQLIQSIFPESDWTTVNDILGIPETVTMTGNTDHDGTIHWSIDVEDLPIAYQAVVMDDDGEGNKVPRIKVDNLGNPVYEVKLEQDTDEYGNPVYEVELDGNGNPVLDGDGNPVLKQATDENDQPIWQQATDENGDPLFDTNGDPVLATDENGQYIPVYIPVMHEVSVPVYETKLHYIQYVVTEKYVENYKVPQYEILEDTASVIITNELDGIILPGTGSSGIPPIVFAGIMLLALGAGLLYTKYKKLRKEVI